jgi:hypothetical protein
VTEYRDGRVSGRVAMRDGDEVRGRQDRATVLGAEVEEEDAVRSVVFETYSTTQNPWMIE